MMRTVLLALALPGLLLAQVAPNEQWRTIRTDHFSVHFTPELEAIARRAAAHAETAYGQLANHLHPPRGPIDLVITDNYDVSNGYATFFPSNRIVVFANPAITESSLRFVDDPMQMVITHELVHTFHLDRSTGIWRGLQQLFGRAPFYFPNAYQPSWIKEGLAVYYETLLTESGRIAGSEHRMIARTAALAHRVPRLDQLSLANPVFPYGHHAYAYGGLFMDHLARAHGDSAMRVFVESSSRQLIPWLLAVPSRRAFGMGFTAAYSRWAASLLANAPLYEPPMPGWRDLTVDGAFANFPRWIDDSTLVYSGTSGRESYGAYSLTLTPAAAEGVGGGERDGVVRRRLGRRHTESPNTVLADGSLLYSQLEYTSPYHLRSDLYVSDARGRETRLTRGARLSTPDARADGRIVAVQTIPAGTRIALVSRDGARVTPITSGGPDQQWLEPRWSPDGRHIAAARWTLGGTSEVVVLDTTGAIVATLVSERTVNASPSWSPDGRYVYFSSDRTGITNLYQASFPPAFATGEPMPPLRRVSDAQTGLFEPQRAPRGQTMSAVVFRADGYHVGIAPLDSARAADAPALQTVAPRAAPSPAAHAGTATRYSPWRTLLPRYWMPFFASALEDNGYRIGAGTSGEDVVGRHAYNAVVLVPTDQSGLTGAVSYRNARLGQPVIELAGSQDWENFGVIRNATPPNAVIGMLRRRTRTASAALTVRRPRVRTSSLFSLSGGIEARDYAADSTPLIDGLDPAFQQTYYYPRVAATMGWGNTQFPPNAISPEDGITLASTTRYRWRTDDDATGTVSVVASGSAFKSLDLPGFAHHVLALRGAGGWLDNRGTGYLEVGGLSGGVLDIFPGYVLGEGRRTFGVRGFPAAAMLGMRAFVANAEYRAPFRIPARGLGTLPVFLGRTSVTLFGDVGSAWCPRVYPDAGGAPTTSLCSQQDVDVGRAPGSTTPPLVFLEPTMIGSVGAELNADAAVLSWDAPYRWRLGLVAPVLNTGLAVERRLGAYLTVGVSF
ncbi:MAG: hypothetical protein WD801_14995 [Gemmatimonadaceae bacterium]